MNLEVDRTTLKEKKQNKELATLEKLYQNSFKNIKETNKQIEIIKEILDSFDIKEIEKKKTKTEEKLEELKKKYEEIEDLSYKYDVIKEINKMIEKEVEEERRKIINLSFMSEKIEKEINKYSEKLEKIKENSFIYLFSFSIIVISLSVFFFFVFK